MNKSERIAADRPASVETYNNSYKELLVELRWERVLFVRFNRPSVLNAFNQRMSFELIRILQKVKTDPQITIVVFSGVGNAFCSGKDLSPSAANIKALRNLESNPIEREKERWRINQETNNILRLILWSFISCPKLLIALVNGPSVGVGFTLAALCDIVYCTENAFFEAPFTRLGLAPEMSSSYLFPRIFGRSKATEILTLGARLTSDDALRYGFVARIFNKDELDTQFWTKMMEYSLLPPKALKISKSLLFQPIRENLLKSFSQEIKYLHELSLDSVNIKAVEDFQNKRKINGSKL